MDKKSFISRQIVVILWIVVAAVTMIEGMAQFQKGGFKNPVMYLMFAMCGVSAYMFFTRRNKRLEDK